MLKFLALSFCLLTATSAFAEGEHCSALSKNIKVSFPQGLPQYVQADSTITIPVKITVSDLSLLEPFRSVPVLLLLSNGQYGANKYSEFFHLKHTTSTETRFSEDFQFNAHFGKNVFGIYKFEGHLAFYDEQNGMCAANIESFPHEFITVLNDPENADSHAPILTSITTDKPDYIVGERVEIRFNALDKSNLCTIDLVEQKSCETIGHISLVEVESGREVHAFPEAPARDNDSYTISFIASMDEDFLPGRYQIKGINVDDVWGNGNHDIAVSLQTIFRVR